MSKKSQKANGYLDPNNNFFYIDIHKNASSKFSTIFLQHSWQYKELFDLEQISNQGKIFCILRDPFERYISGFTQFIDTASDVDAEFYNNLTTSKSEVNLLLKDLLFFRDTEYKLKLMKLIFMLTENFEFDIHTRLQVKFIEQCDISKIDFFLLNDNVSYQINSYFENHNKFDVNIDNKKIHANFQYPNKLKYQSIIKNFFNENIQQKQNLLKYLEPDFQLLNTIKVYAG